MSSNPQALAVEALVAKFKQDYVRSGFSPEDPRDYSTLVPRVENGETGLSALTLGEVVDCLAEAGLLVTPQASSGERSEEDLVEAVSRKLQQDFLLCIGPNTRKFIEDGQERIPLSLRECYDVACAAVSAYRQVVRGE